MSLTPETKPNKNTIPARRMRPGQIGIIVKPGSEFNGVHLLCTFENLISMQNPGNTWARNSDFQVELTPDGTTFTYKAPD